MGLALRTALDADFREGRRVLNQPTHKFGPSTSCLLQDEDRFVVRSDPDHAEHGCCFHGR